MPASSSALLPFTSGRPGAAPISIAMVSVTRRPVVHVPPTVQVVNAPHVAVTGYVWAPCAQVATTLTVAVFPAVRFEYVPPGAVQPEGSAVTAMAPEPGGTFCTL